MSEDEWKRLVKEKQDKNENKFRNKLATRNGIRFDSKKEAARYDELMVMLRAGAIRDLRLQQEFTLQEKYVTATGELVRAIRYVADFTYERKTSQQSFLPDGSLHSIVMWEKVVEDVKSPATITPVYKIKRKMMQDRFGITVAEV